MKLRGRTRSRAQALQLLFQAEANGHNVEDILDADEYTIEPGPLDDYGRELATGADGMRESLDAIIEQRARGWALSRLANCDRNILRLALYEMIVVDEVDISVSIDEAVRLAHAFGTDDSTRFINGILGNVADELESGKTLIGG